MAKILLIDGASAEADKLQCELELAGYSLDLLHKQELKQAEQFGPDIIVLDMPVVEGIEALRKLKSRPPIQTVPIILLSASDDEDVIVRALDLGAYDYESKPVIYPVLTARIRAALRLRQHQQLLAQANRNLATLAAQDPLTEVCNRRHFLERTEAELTQARRHRRSLAIIMLDVDEFKDLNDRYGHAMGDSALTELTTICANNIRTADFIGRLGGEEFAICCPDADLPGAQRMAERIREAIDQHAIHYQGNSCSMTVSLGVTAFGAKDHSLQDFIDRADRLMYQAKKLGRNRVVTG